VIVRLSAIAAGRTPKALATYLTESHKAVAVGYSHSVLSEATAVAEMQTLCDVGRTRRPLWHMVLSWDASDPVTPEEALDTGRDFLDRVGAGDLLALGAAHGDGAYRHAHFMVCRVHPHTRRTAAISPATFAQAKRSIVETTRWRRVSATPTLGAGARDSETWNGEQSLTRWLRGELARAAPDSWETLDAALGARGLRREARRGGFVFVDATTDRTYAVRASAVGIGRAMTAAWGPAPDFTAHVDLSTLSYGRLIQREALPLDQHAARHRDLRAAWRARAPRSQFGHFLRRGLPATLSSTEDERAMEHTSGGPTNSIGGGATDGAAPSAPDLFDDTVEEAVEREEPEIENTIANGAPRDAGPEPAAGAPADTPADTATAIVPRDFFAAFAVYQAREQAARLSQDEVLAALIERDAQMRAVYEARLRDVKGNTELSGREYTKALVTTLASYGYEQEEAALGIASATLTTPSYKPKTGVALLEEYFKYKDVPEAQRPALRTLYLDDERLHAPRYAYDERLAAMVGVEVGRQTEEETQYVRAVTGPKDGRRVVLFRDKADGRLHLDIMPDSSAIDAALATAHARWGTVDIRGSHAFVEKALERAARLGIEVSTPELAQRYAQLRTEVADEQRRIRSIDGLHENVQLPAWGRFATDPVGQTFSDDPDLRSVERTRLMINRHGADPRDRCAFGDMCIGGKSGERKEPQHLRATYVASVALDAQRAQVIVRDLVGQAYIVPMSRDRVAELGAPALGTQLTVRLGPDAEIARADDRRAEREAVEALEKTLEREPERGARRGGRVAR
jgi:hypothetical protein